jgi:Domain of unknown function (DUF6268)
MLKAALIRSALAAVLAQGTVTAMSIQDPGTDVAFLEFEPYPSIGGERFGGPAVAVSSNERAWRLAGQLSFPAGKIGDNQFFGSFKSTIMDRDIIYAGNRILNDGVLQRYWLSGGATWPGRNGQSSLVLAGVGVNSDFADLSPYDFNTEWIASHSWTLNPDFSWGLGLDVQQYFHKFQPYPLIFVDWKVTDRTKIKWDADYLEMRRFLNPWLCFTAGVRFNLEFFALKEDADFEYNSAGLEAGFQYAVGANFYARIKYKELVWGEETLGLPDGSHHTRDMDAGRSLRLNFAYGI